MLAYFSRCFSNCQCLLSLHTVYTTVSLYEAFDAFLTHVASTDKRWVYREYNLIPSYVSAQPRLLKALLIVYGASTSTTLLPCVYHLLSPQIPAPAPLPGSSKSFSFTSLFDDIPPRSGELSNLQLLILLGSYIPFFLFPFAITVDMCRRVSRALVRQEKSEAQAKSR
jgi:hypothetical protein